jgi:uncharacterized protein YbaP (TraB family)
MRSAALAIMLLLGTAEAGDAPPVSDWVPDETVVVRAQPPGPSFWHIKKGDSDLYILATIADLPAGTNFEDSQIMEVLHGARVVLLPPKASNGFLSTGWFLLWNRSLLSMPDGKKLEDTLPPDLKARYDAVLDGLKIAHDKFSDDPPILAAMRLEGAFAAQKKLIQGGFEDTMETLAAKADVPVTRIAEYDALGLVKEILRLPQPAQQACLAEAVSDIEQRNVHLAPLVAAWVVGDVKAIKAHYTPRPFWNCARATENFNKLYERAVNDYLRAIDQALSKPGKSVLVTDIGPLLRESGVVEKLHARGITIEGPAE